MSTRSGASAPVATASTAQLLAYGVPALALAYLLFFVQFYYLKFATDVLLLPPVAVGVLFAVAKLWDAISNPLVGSWSDRTRSRFGRRRPFLFAALPVFGGAFVLLWNPPASLAGGALLVWQGAMLFALFTGYALYAIPHAALGAELSTDSHQRTRLFGAKQIAFTIGMLLAFAGIQVAMNAAAPRQAAARLAWPAAAVGVAVLAVTPLLLRERGGNTPGGQGLRAGVRDLVANRAARILLTVWLIESIGMGAVGTMAPYVAEYVLHRPDVVGTLPAAYVIAGVVTIPIWVRISRRAGARDTWLVAMLFAASAFGGMLVVAADALLLLIALLVVAGSAMGCGSVLASSLMADIIDADEQRTGERKEGIYSAAMMFALKLGSSIATAGSGVALGVIGFVPNVAQSADSELGIRILFAGLPCAGFITGAILFRRFPLGRRSAPEEVRAAIGS